MSDQLLAVLIFQCIEYIKEVHTVRYFSFRHFVWEILHEGSILLHQRPEVDYTQLLVIWDLNPLHLTLLEELLLILKYK